MSESETANTSRRISTAVRKVFENVGGKTDNLGESYLLMRTVVHPWLLVISHLRHPLNDIDVFAIIVTKLMNFDRIFTIASQRYYGQPSVSGNAA